MEATKGKKILTEKEIKEIEKMDIKKKKIENKMNQYLIYLEKEAEKFRLTKEDLSNLTDLRMMIPAWFVKDVLKPNKMDKWFWEFFNKIANITIPELGGKS